MAESPLQFVDLPAELILACLLNLPHPDLVSCLKTGNRLLHDIIANSILVQYRVEQEKACVEENPAHMANSVVSDRLDDLRRREANWLNFTPRSRHSVPIDFATSGVYDLGSDIYLVGDTPDQTTGLSTAIKYIHTSPGSEVPEWHRVDAGKPFIDFGTAMEEHDLIAMVTYTPRTGNPLVVSVEVLLLKFSTGQPHPLAARAALHVHDVQADLGPPGISIEIAGENLAISLVYWSDGEREMDALHLYNWKTGVSKMEPFPVNTTGLVFLTVDTLIVPNLITASLDLYHIPSSDDDAPPRLLHSLYLPELARRHILVSFQCRGEPNPRAAHTRPSRAKFRPRSASALMLFLAELVTNGGPPTYHAFVVHRPRLERALALCDPDTVGVAWSEWGPLCVRWLDDAAFSVPFITATCGMRMAAVVNHASVDPAPIHILDFNAVHVRAQRSALPGDEDTGSTRVRVVEPDVEANAVVRMPFAEPVFSLVPYVDTRSAELFQYAGVLLNDENVVGIKLKLDDGAVDSLEFLHFG
ncbi:hypothetical protein FB451DRAFT_1375279 [Mycena latifolia]|nr:hypothetical protein FB451DRAFT_1375279 [Mycena latifolia]